MHLFTHKLKAMKNLIKISYLFIFQLKFLLKSFNIPNKICLNFIFNTIIHN